MGHSRLLAAGAASARIVSGGGVQLAGALPARFRRSSGTPLCMLALLRKPLVRPLLRRLQLLASRRPEQLQRPTLSSTSSSLDRDSPGASAPEAAAGGTAVTASGGSTTAAGLMVQTRSAKAAEQCRLERVVSNLQASCSQASAAPPVRGAGMQGAVCGWLADWRTDRIGWACPGRRLAHGAPRLCPTFLLGVAGSAAAAIQPRSSANPSTAALPGVKQICGSAGPAV